MRENLRKNRRDRSRDGKKRRVMYKQVYVSRLSSLGSLSLAALLAEIALKRQFDKGSTKGKARGSVDRMTFRRWNCPFV